jgi:hypothetical protein
MHRLQTEFHEEAMLLEQSDSGLARSAVVVKIFRRKCFLKDLLR